ncbi:MAG: hypothetical protein ACKV2T_10905 [Kofleriaceae bacterium]
MRRSFAPRAIPARTSIALIAIVVAAACSSDPSAKPADAALRDVALHDASPPDVAVDAADAFDMALGDFAVALCALIYTCGDNPDGTQAACEADALEDMLGFKMMLDDLRELDCANCMRVTTEQANLILAADCDPAVLDAAALAITAVCDLTPDNGMVDDEEACGGSP